MVLTYDAILEETDNALLIQFGEDGNPTVWVPKNTIVTVDRSVDEIDILDSFVYEKQLEEFDIG